MLSIKLKTKLFYIYIYIYIAILNLFKCLIAIKCSESRVDTLQIFTIIFQVCILMGREIVIKKKKNSLKSNLGPNLCGFHSTDCTHTIYVLFSLYVRDFFFLKLKYFVYFIWTIEYNFYCFIIYFICIEVSLWDSLIFKEVKT